MSLTIRGTGSCLPENAVGNEAFCAFLDTSDEWIASRTGIRQRYFLGSQRLQDIAATAASRAIEDAGIDARQLDLIICPTMQGDDVTPSLACLVQRALGAQCPAFDINAACSGFLYAMELAAACFASQRAKNVLVVCAEQMSKFLDWDDRTTCVLFGDGAGAAVLSQGEALRYIHLAACGQREHLYIPGAQAGGPFAGTTGGGGGLRMNGQEIFKFAVSTALRQVRGAALGAKIALDDIDHFLLHQANGRIIEAVRAGLGQPESRFPVNFASCGNTSSASIPLLLDELNRTNRLKSGDILLMMAFGAGLTSGVCVLEWSR
jgi:3-oxoacyl-[acyl-carrier-protein] synthase-3